MTDLNPHADPGSDPAAEWRVPAPTDNVNHPAHYNSDRFGIECIAIGRHLIGTAFNAWKYTFRHAEKNGAEDLRKALVYLDWAAEDRVPAILDGHRVAAWTLYDQHIAPRLDAVDPVYRALGFILASDWSAARNSIRTRLDELAAAAVVTQ
ncbi:DUF3310 domain-containing protein [Rhodococcus sp. NPDC127528]|uniref:DUF3310 domain-containing protein n=1 Tax=unclassified Rhodococcus (in: high G+C Gram-positive bacteria) TaxID=192944 RepID=UPI00363489D7